MSVNTPFEQFLLGQFGHECCLCRTHFDVHLFAVDPSHPIRDAGYHNVIALCPLCLQRARDEAYAPGQLEAIKAFRTVVSKAPDGDSSISTLVTQAYADALRNSLSPDPVDLKKAAVQCRRILMIQPFHIDAELLLQRLLEAERAFDARSARRDKPLYSSFGLTISRILTRASSLNRIYSVTLASLITFGTGWLLWRSFLPAALLTLIAALLSFRYTSLPWMALYMLFFPYLVYHELSHLTESGVAGVTNAVGQRLPLRRYWKYLEAEVNGACVDGGVLGILRGILNRGEFPASRVNIDRSGVFTSLR
ncbi:MAG TPA: hypothetical protein VK395_11770 [Gemmataceae bacterium]|nr:hypothetical protein [Gemmataceae bacterium]